MVNDLVQIKYIIDEDDLIVSVDPECLGAANPSAEIKNCRLKCLLYERFWNLVGHWESSNFYKLTLQEVRQLGKTVTVPFRSERLVFLNGAMVTFSRIPAGQVLAEVTLPEGNRPRSPLEEAANSMLGNLPPTPRCEWCGAVHS